MRVAYSRPSPAVQHPTKPRSGGRHSSSGWTTQCCPMWEGSQTWRALSHWASSTASNRSSHDDRSSVCCWVLGSSGLSLLYVRHSPTLSRYRTSSRNQLLNRPIVEYKNIRFLMLSDAGGLSDVWSEPLGIEQHCDIRPLEP